jgi:hypothetical protein
MDTSRTFTTLALYALLTYLGVVAIRFSMIVHNGRKTTTVYAAVRTADKIVKYISVKI